MSSFIITVTRMQVSHAIVLFIAAIIVVLSGMVARSFPQSKQSAPLRSPADDEGDGRRRRLNLYQRRRDLLKRLQSVL